MMKIRNIGKVFENNIKNSIPKNILVYRPPDAVQSFDMNSNSKLRFSRHSPCDYFVFDGERLWALECKSFGGSCSFERDKTDNGIIHKHQIDSLIEYSKYNSVVCGFLLDFRKSDNTYFLEINDFSNMANKLEKKSFSENDMLNICKAYKIEKKKLKVNYRYNMEKLFKEFKEEL